MQYAFTQNDINLRQKKWMELLKDYNVTIQYHPRYLLIIVVDPLSWKVVSIGCLAYMSVSKWSLVKEIHTLESNLKLGIL